MCDRGPLFHPPLLYLLLAASMATNAIFIARRTSIDWHAFVHREQPVPGLHAGDHVRGPDEAPVSLVVYTDFQCPFSASFHRTLVALEADEPRVRVVYRHLPLDALHPQAAAAAEASECAAEQGKFWEYADRLFARQADLADAPFPAIAGELNLDREQFATCLAERRQAARVRRDAAAFAEGHLAGTPTWFVNGVRMEGAVPLDDLRRAVAGAGRPTPPAAPPTGS